MIRSNPGSSDGRAMALLAESLLAPLERTIFTRRPAGRLSESVAGAPAA
jgi:hypothetical protein